MGARHFPEGVVGQVKPPGGQARPGDFVGGEITLEPLKLEGAALVNAIIFVDGGYESVLDITPILPQPRQHLRIERHAVSLNMRGSGHIAAPNERSRQVNVRPHFRKQARERLDIGFTIVQKGGPLLGREGIAAHGKLAHRVLLQRLDAAQTKIAHRAQEACPAGRRNPIGQIAKFGKQVEDVGRDIPAKRKVTPDLRRGVIGDKQGVGTGVEGRRSGRPQRVLPEPDGAARDELLCDHADGVGVVSGRRSELEIGRPDFAKSLAAGHQARPCRRLMTGCSASLMT